MDDIAIKIAKAVEKKGGRTFYVGGFVRDKLLGFVGGDLDIEVHGVSPPDLNKILESLGKPLFHGASFGIYSLKGHDIDIAMPRREIVKGRGHRDFEVSVDPFMGTLEASRRRDFTFNALMEDVLSGEIIDHFGGIRDLEARIIRHVNARSFVEDPLRVFRAAQLAARFDFVLAEETVELCRKIDTSALSKERVEAELKKALLGSRRPSFFFEVLKKVDALEPWFSELSELIGLEQDPKYHPEGDVWVHSMQVLDRAAKYRGEVEYPYAFLLLALLHDLGKISTTEIVGDRIHSYGHEEEGLPLIESFLDRLTSETKLKRYVLNMAALHMKPNMLAHSRARLKSTNRMFDAAAAPRDLIYFAMADKPLFAGDEKFEDGSDFLFERLEAYERIMRAPWLGGEDLIEAGLQPGEHFSEALEYAHKIRLAGVDKENALKQTIAYARELERSGARRL
ncbi:MAG: CCA tRNA nucleotidyltransferase [Clostridiales bacterium]|nr:CCA tRNA nucleotidyltransferase [Clostridiales bacterium]